MMKFELNGKIIFSKELNEDAQKDIIEVLDNSREIFLKGVPKGKEDEASKIISYDFEGKELKLKIVSGTYARAHEAIMRLKKPIMEKVGRKHKTGIRDIVIEHYEITIPAEKEVLETIKGIKVPECETEIDYDNNAVKIIFENIGDSELKRNIVDRAIKFVRNELEKIFEKFVAMEKMLDKIHGENAENKIQEEIMTSETHFTDLQGFYINLMGDILSQSE